MINKIISSVFALSATVFACWGADSAVPVMNQSPAMKTLPIYSNDLIDEAPEGQKVIGIRDCFSCYFQGGDHYRNFESGVIGEYVIGTDGNVYLRAVCYDAAQISKQTDTYLKLEKVDETTYVAHTPQLIWVDNLDEGAPFTAYATRVVFVQKSATSFGYEIQEKPDGSYDTDIYFTLADGKLKQQNQNTFEMNDEIFPEELIGFTNSAGGWIGFGDGCLTIYQPETAPTALPENATVSEKSLDYNLLHVRDKVLNNAVLVKYAEVGDELYISNPSASSEQWIKGDIDRVSGTVTFAPQYLGMDAEKGYAVWFTPVTYDKYVEIFDEETGFGDWFRTYTRADKLVCKYEEDKLTSSLASQAMFFSHSPEQLLATGVYADPVVTGYKNESLTPAPVTFTKYEEYDDLWGFGVVGFAIPCMDIEGTYINPDELFFSFYPDDSTEPYEFSSDDYIDMVVPAMTQVPYGYIEDFDFKVNGVNHTVYFYHDWAKVGVQVIQKHGGVETRSEIVYSDGHTGLTEVTPAIETNSSRVYKTIRNGQLIIVRDGVEYNVLGQPVN